MNRFKYEFSISIILEKNYHNLKLLEIIEFMNLILIRVFFMVLTSTILINTI